MNWKPLSTITKSSGMSLVEVLVSSAIFVVLGATLAGLLLQNQRVSEKNIRSADTTSTLLLMVQKIRQEMNGGRVVGNSPPETLDYWIYERQGDSPVFGGPHGLVFLPGAGSDPDVATLKLVDGRLVREFQGEERSLAFLGDNAEIIFDWWPKWNCLKVTGHLSNPYREKGADPPRKFNYLLALTNLE